MKKILSFLLCMALSVPCFGANLSALNGKTISGWNGKTWGTTSGNVNAWNGLMASGGGGSTCTQRFSDNFDRTNSDTVGTGWTESGWEIYNNKAQIVDNYSTLEPTSTFSTLNQYIKITAAYMSSGFYNIFVRSGATTWYDIKLKYGTGGIEWLDANSNTIQTSTSLQVADGDSFGLLISGTGSNTVLSIWKNPTNNIPFSIGPGCSDSGKPCWDSITDPPDLQFTNNPTTAADDGYTTGLYSTHNGNSIDNFFMGDCQ